MWGTDGVRVFTVDDGWGWIFTAVEHWNAECVGWHVCKRGDRFAALQPISMGLAGLYGSTAAGAARGLALRMDHGSQYLSDHFTNQIKFGVPVVSSDRTLKEQMHLPLGTLQCPTERKNNQSGPPRGARNLRSPLVI